MKTLNVLHSILFLICLVCLFSCTKKSPHWNQFRGANGSGVAAAFEKPPIEIGQDHNLQWKITLPDGISSPIVWQDHIYVTGCNQDSLELQLLCIDRKSGENLWTQSVFVDSLSGYHPISSPVQCTPCSDEEGVYVHYAPYGLICYAHNGTFQWEHKTPFPANTYGHTSSPIVINDVLILNLDYGDEETRALYALNKYTGEIIWKTLMQKETPFKWVWRSGYSTPVVCDNQIIVHRSRGIVSYSREDGKPIWWISLSGSEGISTPVVSDSLLYVSAWGAFTDKEFRGNYFEYGNFEKVINEFDDNSNGQLEISELPEELEVYGRDELDRNLKGNMAWSVPAYSEGLDRDTNQIVDKAEWDSLYMRLSKRINDVGTICIPLDKQGEITMNQLIWNQIDKCPEQPSPLLLNNCVFTIMNGGWLTSMNAQTGEVYLCERLATRSPYFSSPVAANGYLYLCAHNGTVSVVKADSIPEVVSATKLEGKILATPAITNNAIYIRTSKYLYAFHN